MVSAVLLFSLLEMRWEIITSNPRLMMAAMLRLLVERFGGQAGTRYSEAVQTLAPFYPIIADRLAGEGIIRIDTRLREHYDRVRQHPIIAADPLVPAFLGLVARDPRIFQGSLRGSRGSNLDGGNRACAR